MVVDVKVPGSDQQTSGRLIYIRKQRSDFGICHRLRQGTPLKRLTWLLLLFLLLLLLCLLVYSKAPFNQVSSSLVERNLINGDQKANLPGVTICSQNPVNKGTTDYPVDADEYYSLLLQLWFLDMKRLQEEVPSIKSCDTLEDESADTTIQRPFNDDTHAEVTFGESISNDSFTPNTFEDITGRESASQSHSSAEILTTQSGSNDDFTANISETISIGGSISQNNYPELTTFSLMYSNLLSPSFVLSSEPILPYIYSSAMASVDGQSDYDYSELDFEPSYLQVQARFPSSYESVPSITLCTPSIFWKYPYVSCFISRVADGYFGESFNPFSFDLDYDIRQDFATFFGHYLWSLGDYSSWDLSTIIDQFVTSKTSASQWGFDSFYLWWFSLYSEVFKDERPLPPLVLQTYIDKVLNFHRDIEWDVSTFLDYYYGSSRDPLLQWDTFLSNMISQSSYSVTNDWDFTTFYLWFFSFFSPTYRRLDFEHSITMTFDGLLKRLSRKSRYDIDRDWDWTSFMQSITAQMNPGFTRNLESFDTRWQFDTFYLWWFSYFDYVLGIIKYQETLVYGHTLFFEETFSTLWRSNNRDRGASFKHQAAPISFIPETELDISDIPLQHPEEDTSVPALDATFKLLQEQLNHEELPQSFAKDFHVAGRSGRTENSIIKGLVEHSKLYDLSDISTLIPWTYDLLRDPDLAFDNDIYSCTLDGLPCNKKHFHLWKHQRYGNCYTFVGDEESENNPTFHKRKADLKIALQQSSSDSGLFMGSGYHLMIHESTEFSGQNGINMEIVEDMEMTITQKQQKKLQGYGEECLNRELNQQFSYSDCREECEDALLQDECGCSQLMETSEDRLCTSDDMNCVMDFRINHESDSCQNCIPRCTGVTYEVEKMARLSKTTDHVNFMRYLLKDEECSALNQLTESDLMELQIYLEPKKVEISADCTLNVNAMMIVAVAVYVTTGLSIISLVALLIELVVTIVKTKSIYSIYQMPKNVLVQD